MSTAVTRSGRRRQGNLAMLGYPSIHRRLAVDSGVGLVVEIDDEQETSEASCDGDVGVGVLLPPFAYGALGSGGVYEPMSR